MTKLTDNRIEEVKKILEEVEYELTHGACIVEKDRVAKEIDDYYSQLFTQPLPKKLNIRPRFRSQPLDDEGVLPSRYTGLYDDWFFGDCGDEMTWKEFQRRSKEAKLQRQKPLDDKELREKLQDTYGVIRYGLDAYRRYRGGWSQPDDWDLFQYELDQILALLQPKIEEAQELLRAQVPNLIDEAKEQERERIFEKVESMSHKMNTNMYGISLSREDWQAIKGGE